MTDREVELKLKKAVENSTPDVLESVLRECNAQNGKVMTMTENKRKSNWLKGIIGIAAAIVVVVGGVFGYNAILNNNDQVVPDIDLAATVTFDVNPSIEMTVNSKERVIAVKALNDDAKAVIGDMDLKDSDVKVAVNALVGSMVRNGYINELANSILVSVDSFDAEMGAALQAKLSAEIEALLKGDSFNGAVLSQTVKHDDDIDGKAKEYGITVGKAQLIKSIVAADRRYTFEQLVPLSINELNLLSSSGQEISANVGASGIASDSKYIGRGAAKAAALAHAGVGEADIRDYEVDMDYENGRMVYEIEFRHGGYEYEYDIAADDGSVVKNRKDIDDDYIDDDRYDDDHVSGSAYIGIEAAKNAAFAHADVNASDVRDLEAELDEDDGVVEYHIEFKAGGYEYEYDIDPVSGAVKNVEKDRDD